MKRILFVLAFFGSPVDAQDFHVRADDGDLAMASEVGQAYSELVSPLLQSAVQACAKTSVRMDVGDRIVFIARVARDGALSAVQVDPPSAASDCISKELRAARFSPPEGWRWERGDFPLTLRIGFGRAATPDRNGSGG